MSHTDPRSRSETGKLNRRPHIPDEVSRAVFFEAGYRCAACGIPFPLERAHIIPWSKTRDDSAENLICLCANCHERADSDWGEAALRDFKRNPWVTRQYRSDALGESETVVITIHLTLNEFEAKKKQLLVYGIAGFLSIPPESVELRFVEEGSVKVFVRLNAEAASRLLHAYAVGDPELYKHFGDLTVTDIKTKTEEMIARRAHELWQAQGCPVGRDVDLWLQAEREIVRINAEAGARLQCFASSFLDFLSALNDTRQALSQTKLQGARLTDHLIQHALRATRNALQRITGRQLSLELFGIGNDDWVPVTSEGRTISAKVLFYENVLMGGNVAGSVEELIGRGDLPASVVQVLDDEGIRAVAAWRVHAADISNQRTIRPALLLYALASDRNAFADGLTRYILDQGAALLGIAIEVGQRDEILVRSSILADDRDT